MAAIILQYNLSHRWGVLVADRRWNGNGKTLTDDVRYFTLTHLQHHDDIDHRPTGQAAIYDVLGDLVIYPSEEIKEQVMRSKPKAQHSTSYIISLISYLPNPKVAENTME